MNHYIEQLTQKLSPLTAKIANHQLYADLASIANIQVFMAEHVFAVWDFMCLLKELHRNIVSVSAPWFPPKDAWSANLISSILVEEEGDVTEDGNYASHFNIYLAAMEQIGANTKHIHKFMLLLMNGFDLKAAIDLVPLLPNTKKFVATTFSFFNRPLHELAAAFVYGREAITPGMFTPMLQQLESETQQKQQNYSTLIYYLKRHIALDSGEHFPKALIMLANIIGDDKQKLKEAEKAATLALSARIDFLDGIHTAIQEKHYSIAK